MYKIELVSKNTQEIHSFDNLTDVNDGEKLYYKFNLNMSDIADGEYSLSLYEGDKLIAVDSLTIGDFDIKGIQAQKGDNIYISTTMNVETEEKNVDITDIVTIIVPTDGVDAMTKVQVNAQAVRDNAYTEGYESGNTDGYNNGYEVGTIDGKEYQKEQLTNIEITSNGTYEREDGYKKIDVNVEGKIEGNYVMLDTTGVTNMKSYFTNKPITSYNIDFGGVAYTDEMFSNTLIDGINEVNLPDATTAKLMYSNCRRLTKAPKIIAPKLENASYMFFSCINITSSPDIDLPAVTNLSDCFSAFASSVSLLTKFPNINAPELKNASNLFNNCENAIGFPTINAPKLENASGMFRGCKGITSVPDLYFPELTNASDMFGMCIGIASFGTLSFPKVTNTTSMFSNSKMASLPYFDTSNVTTMKGMFQYCQSLTSVAEYNTSNVTDMSDMFYYCQKLETVPHFDTSNVTDMNCMFQRCQSLTSVPHFDTSNVTNVSSMFYTLSGGKLVSLPLLDFGKVTIISMFFGGQSNLTDLGGFKNLKIDWNDNYGLASCPNLTYQSIMNVINNLYDFRANGDSSTTRTLKMHKNTMALLTDNDKVLANSKGWVLTS